MAKSAVMSVLHNVDADYPAELKAEIFRAIGNIDHIEIWGQEILVAAFVQSPFFGTTQMLKGDKEQKEDMFQGKSFMILQCGLGVEAAAKRLGLPMPQVGNWCFADVKVTDPVNIRGVGFEGRRDPKDTTKFIRPWGNAGWPCRFILINDIRGRTTRPQDVM